VPKIATADSAEGCTEGKAVDEEGADEEGADEEGANEEGANEEGANEEGANEEAELETSCGRGALASNVSTGRTLRAHPKVATARTIASQGARPFIPLR